LRTVPWRTVAWRNVVLRAVPWRTVAWRNVVLRTVSPPAAGRGEGYLRGEWNRACDWKNDREKDAHDTPIRACFAR
jgi:hypothetical protein